MAFQEDFQCSSSGAEGFGVVLLRVDEFRSLPKGPNTQPEGIYPKTIITVPKTETLKIPYG